MVYKLTDNELRNLCKEKLESLENWLRRLIDEIPTAEYGDYFSYSDSAGNLINNDILNSLKNRMGKNPSRYQRKIDAVLLDDTISIICNRKLYALFKPALEGAFPYGADEARTFLNRLIDPRNQLAHANSISQRQAEQVICYSNDVIESMKTYYAKMGMQQDYNVPLILKVTDSFGNTFFRDQLSNGDEAELAKVLSHKSQFFLRPGDLLTVEVEVDPAFNPNSYKINWHVNGIIEDDFDRSKAVVKITNQHVAQSCCVYCCVTSNKEWHRMSQGCDDILLLYYRVLPLG